MATRTPTKATLASRAFRKIAEIEGKRTKATAALAKAREKYANTNAALDADESDARKALADYGFTADAVAADLTTTGD